MSINGQGHSLTLVKGHSDFKVKCLNFGLYTQVSDSGPLGPLVFKTSGPDYNPYEEIIFLTPELSLINTCCWRADHKILRHDSIAGMQ